MSSGKMASVQRDPIFMGALQQVVNEFDPQGLIRMGCPEDEYSPEITMIYDQLFKDDLVSTAIPNNHPLVHQVINTIFIEMFGAKIGKLYDNGLAWDIFQLLRIKRFTKQARVWGVFELEIRQLDPPEWEIHAFVGLRDGGDATVGRDTKFSAACIKFLDSAVVRLAYLMELLECPCCGRGYPYDVEVKVTPSV